jgi:hypothetical protein
MKHVLRVLVLGALAVLLTSTALLGQGATAQIAGAVRDQSGATLPGVDVTVTQTETGFTRATVTDEGGNFVLSNLPTGPYRLQATLAGFRTFQQTGIVLQVNANPTINIALALGQLNETITVVGQTPLIETRTPSIGQVIENEKIEELPLNGRNATQLIELVGASVPQPALNATSRSMQGGTAIAVAGGQAFGVAYSLDGATHNNPYDNLNLPLPFPDALQEFRVETSTTNANNGMHSSAAVNAVTKSGTNRFHGDLFEFARNHRFNATNPFNRVDAATGKRVGDGLSRNQFGGTLGGPIVSNRVFFFGAYQGSRQRELPSDLFAFIPTAQMLAGDFTTFASNQCNATNVALRAPFVGNRVDPALFSPAAKNIVGRLGLTTTNPCGRVNYSRSRPEDEAQYIAKIDFQMSQNHSLFGRYMMTTAKVTPPMVAQPDNLLVSNQGGRDNKAHSLTIGDTMVLSNSMVNAIRFAYNYTDIHRIHEPLGFSAPDVGIKSFSYLEKYMLLGITGGFTLGGGTESEARFKTPSYHFSDDLTLIRGSHQLGVGGTFARWSSLSQANVRSPGQFTVNGSVTGLGLADFMLGRISEFTQAVPNTLDMTQLYLAAYFSDTWKISSNATLNYGIRWEPGIAQQIKNGAIYNFDLQRYLSNQKSTVFPKAPSGFVYPGDDSFINDQAGMKNYWNQFSPRVGFAWDPAGDGKMSIRTGYSLANDFVNGQFHLNTSVAWPWGAEVRCPTPAGGLDDPFGGCGQANIFPFTLTPTSNFGIGGPYIAIPEDIELPRQQSWNVSVQRQLGNNMALSATYIGTFLDRGWNVRSLNEGVFMGTGPCTLNTTVLNRTTGITSTVPQTFPVCTIQGNINSRRKLTIQNYEQGKFLGSVDEHTSLAEQQYNGLLLSVQKRSSNGLSVSGNYTWSKCEGHPVQGGTTPNVNSGYVNPNDIDYDYGACNADRRHVMNLSGSYQTPQFSAQAMRLAFSDWRLSGIYRVSSGSPLTVTVNTDPAGTGIGGQRANMVLESPYGGGTLNNFLNIAAFSAPTPGTYGNQKRNSFTGPGLRNVDLSLVRSFRFASTHRIEARLEAYNAFNWFRWGNPSTNFNAPATFGRIQTALDPRILQFAVKYQF